MTKREKVRQIYLNMPYLVNDDMGTLIYIMKRHGMDLTEDQEQAFRRMGNPEHWTRQFRILREKDDVISKMVGREAVKERTNKFLKYIVSKED